MTITLKTALADYPWTKPLKSGAASVPGVTLQFEDVKPVNRAFAPMAREQKFDVSEMAIVTYLLAKAYNKPILLLPIVMMGLTAIGIVNPVFLGKYRRYAAVAGLLAGGFITPDPTAMFVIAIPVYLLFELSLVLSRLVLRAKERRKAKEENDDTEPPSGGSPPRGLPPGGAGGSGREPRRLGAPA